jgi:prevent-host-death family protein
MRRTPPNVKTLSSNEAKQRWGSVISAVSDHGERVVVESHGKPKVAVVSVHDLERLEALDERERRDEALTWLREFEKRQAERNADLTEEEVERIAVEVGREINRTVAERWRQRVRDNAAE